MIRRKRIEDHSKFQTGCNKNRKLIVVAAVTCHVNIFSRRSSIFKIRK